MPSLSLDIGELGIDRGAHLLVQRALARLEPGARLEVRGTAPELAVHTRAWCRGQGHHLASEQPLVIVRGRADIDRWSAAHRTGVAHEANDAAEPTWGLAARGAVVEAGAPAFNFPLRTKNALWADEAAALYRQAIAAQWDPEQVIPWQTPMEHPAEVERALVQILTFLIENETAALLVSARFCAQVHPHFREILQLLAVQAADEARHIEVFTRRATLSGVPMGTSSAGGQASLKTLVEEPNFELAAMLLGVMGEGTFLSLLNFLRRHAPDACTAEIMKLAGQDEARHVAFGMAHLLYHSANDPTLKTRLAAAVERRHGLLEDTAGLNTEVFDALVVLAAGSWSPAAIGRGYAAVTDMVRDMDVGRQRRLRKLGFTADEASTLSAQHTRNFM